MSDETKGSLFDSAMGTALVCLVWAVVVCLVLSMSRCTYDVVVGNKAESPPAALFQPR